MKTAAQVAREAAEIMAERGHCKFIEEDEQGRVCFAGAVNAAAFGDPYPYAVFNTETAALLSRSPERNLVFCAAERIAGQSAVAYNNREYVTGEDVILLLKKTAERLEEGEEGKR